MRLRPRQVEKPWGRIDLPPPFQNEGNGKIGEIWFESSTDDVPFLVKYIFTSERLSVQVHPDDAQARARGEPRGKTECWYVVDADNDAQLGIGLTREISGEELRSAALDGSIMGLLAWRPVAKGDFVYVPAGTIHAIGAGVSLLEFQQNSNVTYRLYDYGRPRELHLDDAVSVATAAPYRVDKNPGVGGRVLHTGADFTVIKANSADDIPDRFRDHHRWVMPLSGEVEAGDGISAVGDCLLLLPGDDLAFRPGAMALVGAEGPL